MKSKFSKIQQNLLVGTIHKKCSNFRAIHVGLAGGEFPAIGSCVGLLPNSYAIDSPDHCWLSQEGHTLEWPNGVPRHKWSRGDVIGCGLMKNRAKELSIFFTLNGILLGQFHCYQSF
jgi:hypothetical protein